MRKMRTRSELAAAARHSQAARCRFAARRPMGAPAGSRPWHA